MKSKNENNTSFSSTDSAESRSCFASRKEVSLDPLRIIANLTHELKTPLHAIISTTSILQSEIDGKLSEEQKKQVSIVLRNSEHLLEMINSLLNYSSTLTPTRHLSIKKISVSKLIASLVAEIGSFALSRDIKLEFIDDSSKQEIFSDSDLLKRIISNLLSNALKFTKQDGTVSIYLQDSQGSNVRVVIADTGVGMDQQTKENIFSAFYQADTSSTREYGGVGLGLSLVKSACSQIQAKIKVESELDKGSIFTVEIPDLRQKLRKRKAFFVSDDSALFDSLRLVLEDDLFELEKILFDEFYIRLNDLNQDIILLDDLGDESFYSLTNNLSKISLSARSNIICFLNTKKAEKRAFFIDAGFKDVLYKPFNSSELIEKIKSFYVYEIL